MKNHTLMQDVKKIHNAMFNKQTNNWVASWTELRDYFAPHRGFFDGDQANDGRLPDAKKVINDTGIKASEDMAAGISSGLTSPSQPWFSLSMEDKELNKKRSVKIWLKQVMDLLYSVFRNAGAYTALDWLYSEIGVFGTGAVVILEDAEKVIRFVNYTCGEYALEVNSEGNIDRFARKWQMTAKQMVDRFGYENVSANTRSLYDDKNRCDDQIEVKYLIIPNDAYMYNKKNDKPYSAFYWETTGDDEYLEISGFHEYPVLNPRWEIKNSTTAYGFGPGWKSLGDNKMLQRMEKDKLKGVQKVVDPPIIADAGLKNQTSLIPGGISYFNMTTGSNAGVKPVYQIDFKIREISEAINNVEYRIQRSFYTDLFLMLTNNRKQNKTATEVAQLTEEKRILGPVLERMSNEILTPLIIRTISILSRQGKLPEPPKEIQGRDFKIEYVSVLAKAQKASRTASVEQFMAFVANTASVKPEVLDMIDVDASTREYADMIDVPPEIVNDEAIVAQTRLQRQQAAAMQQQAEQTAGAIQGAKTMSETQIDGKNAIDKIQDMTGTDVV